MKRYVWLFTLLGLLSCSARQSTSSITQKDKDAIEALARDLPLILSNQGWDAYEATFAEDYQNWSMAGDQVRSRVDYLALVKNWYDQGNRATGSTLKTIDFVPINNQTVMYLYALQERFNDSVDSTITKVRDIRFVASYL